MKARSQDTFSRRGVIAAVLIAGVAMGAPAIASKKRMDEPSSGGAAGGGGGSGKGAPAGGTQSAAANAGRANAAALQNKEIAGAAKSHSARKDRKATGHEK